MEKRYTGGESILEFRRRALIARNESKVEDPYLRKYMTYEQETELGKRFPHLINSSD